MATTSRHVNNGLVGTHVKDAFVSWFGGPNDHQDGGGTASGIPQARGGVAINPGAAYGGWDAGGDKFLRGYWYITIQGRSHMEQQIDKGPGAHEPGIDVLYSSLKDFGFTEANFPTGAKGDAIYVGRTPDMSVVHRLLNGTITGSGKVDANVLDTGIDPLNDVINAGGDTVNAGMDVGQFLAKLSSDIFSAKFWWNVLKVLIGLGLGVFALITLYKATDRASGGAISGAAKMAAVA